MKKNRLFGIIQTIYFRKKEKMIYPKFLKSGNTIGVPAPSDGIIDELKIKRFQNG